jgi:hypothetical protein
LAKVIRTTDVTKAEIHFSQRYRASAIIIVTILLAFYSLILDIYLFLIFALLWLLICSIIVLAGFRVDDEGVRKLGIWQRNSLVRWEEIERVDEIRTVDRWGAYWVVMNNGKRGIKIFRRMTGMAEFEILVKRHLPEEKWIGALRD